MDTPRLFTDYSEQARTQALARFQQLRPHLEDGVAHSALARHQDGICFQGLRYLDLTLAGYVGEDVTIRYDPRDMAEMRVYHQEQFVCRAVCQEIAEQTLTLKEIIAARRQRHRELREQLSGREAAVRLLLEVHQPPSEPEEPSAEPSTPRLKRYYND